MVDLSLVVLHYNRWDLTKDCIACIDKQELPLKCQIEKVILDNGSTVPLPQVPDGWKLVRYETNRGHIVGQNRCFESTTGKWVLFVANDIRWTSDFLLDIWKERPGFGVILQPFLLTVEGFPDNHGLHWRWPGYGISHQEVEESSYTWDIESFSGSCYLMTRWVWECLSGFDERLLTSHEDIDFSLRLRRMHGSVKRCYGARAVHLGNATLKHQPSHNRTAFHRDRVYVIKKHYHGLNRLARLAVVHLLDVLPRW